MGRGVFGLHLRGLLENGDRISAVWIVKRVRSRSVQTTGEVGTPATFDEPKHFTRKLDKRVSLNATD